MSSEGGGAISLKFEENAYPPIEILFVVGCLPSDQHGFKLLPRVFQRHMRSRVIPLNAFQGAQCFYNFWLYPLPRFLSIPYLH